MSCNLIWLWHSLPGVSITSHKLRGQSHETASLQTSTTKCQLATCTSEKLAIYWGSHNSLLAFGNLLEWLTEFRETHALVYHITKNTNEQPDEEMHRVRSGRAPHTEAPVPVELGCTTPLAHGCVCQCGRTFVRASSCKHDQYSCTPLANISYHFNHLTQL